MVFLRSIDRQESAPFFENFVYDIYHKICICLSAEVDIYDFFKVIQLLHTYDIKGRESYTLTSLLDCYELI